jgi:hypothetical protein
MKPNLQRILCQVRNKDVWAEEIQQRRNCDLGDLHVCLKSPNLI